VAVASGKIDGLMTFGGVVMGSLLFGELYPLLSSFHASGAMGQRFLDQVTGIPRPVLALGVAAMAVACFIGAEKVEAIFRKKLGMNGDDAQTTGRTARKVVFASIGTLAVLAVATLALPGAPRAESKKGNNGRPTTASVRSIGPASLALRLTENPWKLRILDLRDSKECNTKRIPGSECVPEKDLAKLNLGLTAAARDLVLVGKGNIKKVPKATLAYRGKIFTLKGGFDAWRTYALAPPSPPGPDASSQALKAYRFRAAFHQAMTGRKTAAVKVKPKAYVPRKKKKRKGGCS
jgi:rhodanese-related sulfurtransferase